MSFKSSIKRGIPHRQPKRRFMIFCEGTNTEPWYFRSFRLVTATIRSVTPAGGNALVFVQNSIKKWQREKKDYDQCWVVFDKDQSTEQQFRDAIALAQQNKLRIACSNQAFEYWFVLHFRPHTGQPMPRADYAGILSAELQFPYRKDAQTAKQMYKAILNRQPEAIERAERIWILQPYQESSTAVYQLVCELNKYL